MTILTDEMLKTIAVEFERFPKDLLRAYRVPPGRKPNKHLYRLRDSIAHLDDETAEALIRDVMDAAVCQMVYLMGAGFKSGIDVKLARGDAREELKGTLQEGYRALVDPGGLLHKQT